MSGCSRMTIAQFSRRIRLIRESKTSSDTSCGMRRAIGRRVTATGVTGRLPTIATGCRATTTDGCRTGDTGRTAPMSFGVGPADANAVVVSTARAAAAVGKTRKCIIDVHRLSLEKCVALERAHFDITKSNSPACADGGTVA